MIRRKLNEGIDISIIYGLVIGGLLYLLVYHYLRGSNRSGPKFIVTIWISTKPCLYLIVIFAMNFNFTICFSIDLVIVLFVNYP